MSEKQRAKHIADNTPAPTDGTQSELTAAEPTPDGLGVWEGGVVHGAINGLKAKAQRTGDTKNTPGTDYASKINETHQKGYVKPTPAA